MINTTQKQQIVVEAKVIKKDGSIIDLGIIAKSKGALSNGSNCNK